VASNGLTVTSVPCNMSSDIQGELTTCNKWSSTSLQVDLTYTERCTRRTYNVFLK